jgi:RNA polymerase sigma-70 factor, ECF subfamily
MPTDEELYLQLLAGDMAAFDELYRRYERRLFGYVLRQLGDRAEAEDVFHEAFMAVLKEGRTRRALGSFRAWIFQVARNLCLNRLRSRKRSARALLAHADAPEEPSSHAEQLLASHGLPVALESAVARLPEPLQEVYALRVSGLSYDEIASALEIPLGTVKSRMHEMIVRLRTEMQPWTAN